MERRGAATRGRTLIIPAFNEEPVIAQTLARIPAGLFDEVVVADNGSTDGTGAAAMAAGARVVRTEQRGYGAACLAAMATLGPQTRVVAFLQADGSEDAAEAERLMAPIERDEADLVIGARAAARAAPGSLLPHQRFGNWLAVTLIRWLYGHEYSDLGPFRAISLPALQRLQMRDRNYGWTVEMQVRAIEEGLRVVEIPVSYGVRKAGENKVSGNLRASLRAGEVILKTVLRLYLTRRRR